MQKIGTPRLRLLLGATLAVALLAGVHATRSGAMPARVGAPRLVVKTVKNKTLGKSILVDRKGLTLYSLSAEKNGRFICTDAFCRSLWTPLVVQRGTKPTGSRLLATVRRPDGRTQVTYRGLPLYTFNQDRKPGDVKGNGFKDVGIWLPASADGTVTSAPAPGGRYGY